jgi:transposase
MCPLVRSLARANGVLDRVEAVDHATVLRVASVRELVADISHYDTQLKATRKRLLEAVDASGTTLTAIRGCGPVVAALILGHTGDVTRFASTAHFASYNATAPIEATGSATSRSTSSRSPSSATPAQAASTTTVSALRVRTRKKHSGH